jgi:hypothetical protein
VLSMHMTPHGFLFGGLHKLWPVGGETFFNSKLNMAKIKWWTFYIKRGVKTLLDDTNEKLGQVSQRQQPYQLTWVIQKI